MGVREQLEEPLSIKVGKHLIADIRLSSSNVLTDLNYLRDLLYESALKANLKILGEHSYVFENTGGISLILIIAESHISIHTWPEYNFLTLDIFTCGKDESAWIVYQTIIDKLKPVKVNLMDIDRGLKY